MTNRLSQDEVRKAVAKEHEDFQLAIGRLTLAWADAESALYCVLRFYSGVSSEVARAIFSGCRARTMISFIENIAHNTGMEEARRADLKAIFAQMNAINTMRDRIVHYVDGSMIEFDAREPNFRTLSNEKRVGRLGTEFVVKVGSLTVHNMATDCQAICWHLLAHRDSKPFKPWQDANGATHAWLYEPPQPYGGDRPGWS